VRGDGDGGVAVVDVELSTPAYVSDPVRLRVQSASICGSDLKMLSWSLPVTLGHEFAGLLDDGTPVAVQPNAPCGECDLCRAGNDQLCQASNDRVRGIFTDGGLADEVIVDRADVVPLPDGIRVDVGALVEPAAVALHAAHQGGLHDDAPPGRVLVIGAGSIGLLLVTMARDHGATVDLVARHPAQREAGERLGAKFSLAVVRPDGHQLLPFYTTGRSEGDEQQEKDQQKRDRHSRASLRRCMPEIRRSEMRVSDGATLRYVRVHNHNPGSQS
jgi:threonine dehydrogenase-like Zn-dependent dehydrogenase